MIIETVLSLSIDLKAETKKQIKQEIIQSSINDSYHEAEKRVVIDPETTELFEKLFLELNRTNFDFK